MLNFRIAFAGVLAGFLTLITATGQADAAPVVKSAVVKSICDTGYRGMPEYDAKCLRVGTFKSGAMLWLSIPAGKKGHVGREDFTRRSICLYPGRAGLRAAVTEALTDVAYDSFRNYRTVLKYAGAVASLDCKSMGYKG